MHTEMPAPVAQTSCHDAYEKPREGMEEAIAQVWMDAFRVDRIGRNDNFFELGGNSLLAMNLTELLANRLEVQLPVVMLFRYPTVREMAEIMTTMVEP